MHQPANPVFAIVTPCYNEGSTLSKFLDRLESVLARLQQQFIVVVVDDCSADNTLELAKKHTCAAANIKLHVISLVYNQGHQGAIWQGLVYANNLKPDYTIVMDSDGEDDPEAIPLLIREAGYDIVEVKRGRRSENLRFRMLYRVYKLLFKIITGKKMDFGNFSMINGKILERAAYMSFIHFAAFLLKQKGSRKSIMFDRAQRIDGRSQMSMQGLLFHAFRSFIEFAEDLLMVFLKLFILLSVIIVLLFANLLYQKFIAGTAILGWFSTITISIIILATMCLGFFVLGILLLNIMHQRRQQNTVYTIVKSQQ